MHVTYLCPHMDESLKFLEDIIVPKKRLPTGYCKLSLNIPLVDKVVDPIPSSVDPTLSLESEEQIARATLPLDIEVKVVESISSPPDPTLSSESVETEVVPLTQSSFSPSLPIESELKPAQVFMLCSDCSRQKEILSISTEPSMSSEVVSFD